MDLVVRGKRRKKLWELPAELVEKQGLSEAQVEEVKRLQVEQHYRTLEMMVLDPKTEKAKLLELVEQWRAVEFDLQEAWGFKRDKKYHREFALPHCRCPRMDNYELVGTSLRYRNGDCPIHGSK